MTPNVMMTFVQATFVLETFVNLIIILAITDPILTKLLGPIFVSNIPDVIDLILTKLLGPNFLGTIDFLN